MKPNISRVFEWVLGFVIALPNLRVFVVSGVLSVNQEWADIRHLGVMCKDDSGLNW
jgi:hypothetical protein